MPDYQVNIGDYLTSTAELHNNQDYKKLTKVMDSVIRSGAVALGAGSCIGMCRLIYSALKHQGIKSRLVESQLTYTVNDTLPNEETCYIGFDDIKNPGEIDTHVIVITETHPPMLIDASIPHRIRGVVIDQVTDLLSDGSFGYFVIPERNLRLNYQRKISQKIPLIEQISFVDRIQTDEKIFGKLKLLKTLITIAIIISITNATRGYYDHYVKYVSQEEYWGPSAIETINSKIDILNNKIDEMNNKK